VRREEQNRGPRGMDQEHQSHIAEHLPASKFAVPDELRARGNQRRRYSQRQMRNERPGRRTVQGPTRLVSDHPPSQSDRQAGLHPPQNDSKHDRGRGADQPLRQRVAGQTVIERGSPCPSSVEPEQLPGLVDRIHASAGPFPL
jgi:hypothetical protein